MTATLLLLGGGVYDPSFLIWWGLLMFQLVEYGRIDASAWLILFLADAHSGEAHHCVVREPNNPMN